MLSMRKRMSDSRSNRLRPLPLGASLAVSMRNGDEAQSSSCARLLAHERFAVIVVLRDVGSAFCPLLSAEHVWSRPRSAASTASRSSCAALLGGDAGFAPRRRFGEPIVTIVSRSLKAANMTQATSPWPVSTPGFQVGVPRQTKAEAAAEAEAAALGSEASDADKKKQQEKMRKNVDYLRAQAKASATHHKAQTSAPSHKKHSKHGKHSKKLKHGHTKVDLHKKHSPPTSHKAPMPLPLPPTLALNPPLT